VEGGHPDDDERDRLAERRDDEADSREADADQRELGIDARERVLDRWEQEIAARARSLDLLDELAEEDRDRARLQRERAHQQRRDASEVRRDAAIDRDIRRVLHVDRTDTTRAASRPADLDGATWFAALASGLRTNPPLEQALELILAAGVDAIAGCAAASVTSVSTGRLHTVTSTADWAAVLDAAQLELDCGPMPSAVDGTTVATSDLAGDERWPQLAGLPGAARSVISVGLLVDETATGVLTLYGAVGDQFDDRARRVADLLAALATTVLGRTFERLTHEARAEAWQHALASRDVIGQAKGILMEQRSTTADEAFHVLREASQRLNRKLRVIAEHVVTERHLPDD
jgi:hypothetical protein